MQRWKTLSSQMVLNHRWCQVRRDTIELPNGTVIDDFFVHLRPDIALVMPVTSNQEIVFVRQYRHGVQNMLMELPAGGFDPAIEIPETAALRELQEETGYTAQHLIKLGTVYDNPVKDTNGLHLFLALDVIQEREQKLDLTEEIEIVLVPLSKVLEMIQNGEIAVAGTVAALFLGMAYVNLLKVNI